MMSYIDYVILVLHFALLIQDSEEDVPVVYNDLSDGERDDYFPSVGPPQILQVASRGSRLVDVVDCSVGVQTRE